MVLSGRGLYAWRLQHPRTTLVFARIPLTLRGRGTCPLPAGVQVRRLRPRGLSAASRSSLEKTHDPSGERLGVGQCDLWMPVLAFSWRVNTGRIPCPRKYLETAGGPHKDGALRLPQGGEGTGPLSASPCPCWWRAAGAGFPYLTMAARLAPGTGLPRARGGSGSSVDSAVL